MPVISPAPWNEAPIGQNRRVVAAPYRASLSKQSCGADNGRKGNRRTSGNRSKGRNMVFAALTRGLLAAALLVVAAVDRPRPERRPNSTRARPSISTSATASAAATTSMRACSRATWASTSPAIRPWCRRTWRAPAACGSPTGSTTSAPKDGTAFGTIGRGTGFDPLLGNKAAQFDATKFTWIGSANDEVSVCVAWNTTRHQHVRGHADQGADRRRHQRRSADTDQFPRMINGVLGTKMKIVTGYPGGNDINLAMERGEVQGRCGWSWSSVKATHQQWLDGEEDQHADAVLARQAPGPAGRAADHRSRQDRRAAADPAS